MKTCVSKFSRFFVELMRIVTLKVRNGEGHFRLNYVVDRNSILPLHDVQENRFCPLVCGGKFVRFSLPKDGRIGQMKEMNEKENNVNVVIKHWNMS
jgi:hypothetical protein